MHELERAHAPCERKAYLPDFPGFERVLGVRLARARGATMIELPPSLTDEMARSERPHLTLAGALTRSLFALRNVRFEFDVVLILLPEEWQAGFQGQQEEISSFRRLRRLPGMVREPGSPVRLTRERRDGTDGMRPGGRSDRLD